MSFLSGKNILLGITGGIAAYKTTYLIRHLTKEGATIKVVMTKDAKEFVTPLSLSTLSKNEVYSLFTEGENDMWNNHVELGKWADFMIIAPATANTLSKMAKGNSDNFLLAVYLSADCPVYVAPAMDLDMYQHPTTSENIEKLESFGHKIIPSESGELASGLIGQGRMAEPENIRDFILSDLKNQLKLYGQTVLITAGPTQEAIDPVRFISNHSSGKMGYAIAETAANLGAKVILISGPTHLKTDFKEIKVVDVQSADEMHEAAHQYFSTCDIFIAAAAVSDYKPKNVADQKIKKAADQLNIELEKNKDILLSLGNIKEKQFLVGFAMETENEEENAKAKLKKKNLDFIVLNSLREKGAGFQGDTNKIKIIDQNEVKQFDLKSKKEVAQDIFKEICAKIKSDK